jgi:hypothetical protein
LQEPNVSEKTSSEYTKAATKDLEYTPELAIII